MGFWNDGGFFRTVKGHVFKWWQLVIMPVLRINNNSKKSQSGESVQQSTANHEQQYMSQDMQTANEDTTVNATISEVTRNRMFAAEIEQAGEKAVEEQMNTTKKDTTSAEDPMEVLRRINEEKEAKRRQEIEKAREKASEEARIAAIMNANKVDVNAFIQAGKAAKEEIAAKQEDDEAKKRQQEDLLRAQEIMERLNREAAEDEAAKQAEIEAARQEAKKQFG